MTSNLPTVAKYKGVVDKPLLVRSCQANASDVSGRQKLERLGFDGFDVVVDDANHWAKASGRENSAVNVLDGLKT